MGWRTETASQNMTKPVQVHKPSHTETCAPQRAAPSSVCVLSVDICEHAHTLTHGYLHPAEGPCGFRISLFC